MYTTDGDARKEVDFEGKYYKVYCSLESKKGKGVCSICGRKKHFFVVTRVIGIEENYGNEVNMNSDLGKKITEKLKRVIRRETICDHCEVMI